MKSKIKKLEKQEARRLMDERMKKADRLIEYIKDPTHLDHIPTLSCFCSYSRFDRDFPLPHKRE